MPLLRLRWRPSAGGLAAHHHLQQLTATVSTSAVAAAGHPLLRRHHRARALLDHMSQYVQRNLKNRSHTILRLWTEHCEYIVAQRCRRAQQMAALYGRLWEERALRELMRRIRKQVQRHTKGLMLGAAALHQTTTAAVASNNTADKSGAFDWDAGRIPYETLRPHLDEIEFVRQLHRATIECGGCHRRIVIDARVPGVEYCRCNAAGSGTSTVTPTPTATAATATPTCGEWKPYLERENMVVWRREERPGLYAYKVHASYTDVSAEDFLYVQTDTQYRKVWDKTAICLDIVDVDPANRAKSQVVYWEMLWPKFFANRDYVYRRRIVVDRQRRTIVIANQSVQHPARPPQPSKQRVSDYWSYMVIRPTGGSFRRPGLEYVLTYFDNPGVVVPPAITSWVAQKQMPDFLNKLHLATVEYAEQRHGTAGVTQFGGGADDEDDDNDNEDGDADGDVWAGICEDQWWCGDVADPGFEYGDVLMKRFGLLDGAALAMQQRRQRQRRRRQSGGDDGDDDDDDGGGGRGGGGGGGVKVRPTGGDRPDLLDDSDAPAAPAPRKWSWWSYLWPYYYFVSS